MFFTFSNTHQLVSLLLMILVLDSRVKTCIEVGYEKSAHSLIAHRGERRKTQRVKN